MRWTRENKKAVVWGFAVLVITLFFVRFTFDHNGQTISLGGGSGTPSAIATIQSGDTDPDSGLPWVREQELPIQAQGTLALIDQGGPFPYAEDGATFGNFEGLLPDHDRGYYAEYTVVTPGSSDRGARRIIAGDGGEFYWTQDHYESFERIARGQS